MKERPSAIGGYFELELNVSSELHEGALALNSARNCFKYILEKCKPSKVYLPYYICDSMVNAIRSSGVSLEFYSLGDDMGLLQSREVAHDEMILYVNYFGLETCYAEKLVELFGNRAVIDNSQAFFARPNNLTHTIYSPRKFFGVPDGGYLHTNLPIDMQSLPEDTTADRCLHLIGRIESGPEAYYSNYRDAESNLKDRPIRRMSQISRGILASLDYESIALKRERNFLYLHERLSAYNRYPIEINSSFKGPMIYPFLTDDGPSLKRRLIDEHIFVATYWPEVKSRVGVPPFELSLTDNLVPLPIDQRYTLDDMCRIVTVIGNWLISDKQP